jgi:RNA recognition motif-containing protein
MTTKLFVGKLSFNTTNEGLQALFEKYGKVVKTQIITDYESNKSKGFGFVEMENQDEAQKAIEELNEKDFEGRTIVVSVAKPREDRSQGRSNFGGASRRQQW